MNVVLFGATGMVGQGVLRECLLDPDVRTVLSVGRSATGQTHSKLREIIHKDLRDFSTIEPQLSGFDARGETENAILRLPFRTAAVIRPAGIIPPHGITSRTPLYRVAYALTRPLWPVLYKAFPQLVTTTERLGRGMLRIARRGTPKPILEARDINGLAANEAS